MSGKRFMTENHPKAELAPRDIVARSIAEVVNETGDDYVLLDCKAISEKNLKISSTIKENCQKVGINPPYDHIPVIPAAHYFCGGISVNHYGETKLKGLFRYRRMQLHWLMVLIVWHPILVGITCFFSSCCYRFTRSNERNSSSKRFLRKTTRMERRTLFF